MLEGKSQFSRRSFLMGAAMVGAGTVSWLRQPKALKSPISEASFGKAIPKQVNGWVSRSDIELILPPPDELSEKLYEHIETRIYQAPDRPSVMFLTAFSSIQQQDVQVHRPEVCYRVAGFQIISNTPYDVKLNNGLTIPGRVVVAQMGGRTETILYWVRVGRDFPVKWSDQRLSMARHSLNGKLPDGALVRFSMIGSDIQDSTQKLQAFASELVNSLGAPGRAILLGNV